MGTFYELIGNSGDQPGWEAGEEGERREGGEALRGLRGERGLLQGPQPIHGGSQNHRLQGRVKKEKVPSELGQSSVQSSRSQICAGHSDKKNKAEKPSGHT